jgi:hypothetical protein
LWIKIIKKKRHAAHIPKWIRQQLKSTTTSLILKPHLNFTKEWKFTGLLCPKSLDSINYSAKTRGPFSCNPKLETHVPFTGCGPFSCIVQQHNKQINLQSKKKSVLFNCFAPEMYEMQGTPRGGFKFGGHSSTRQGLNYSAQKHYV